MDLFLLFLIIGIIAYISVICSFLTGTGILKVKLIVHKALGFTSIIMASIHGLYMLYINLF